MTGEVKSGATPARVLIATTHHIRFSASSHAIRILPEVSYSEIVPYTLVRYDQALQKGRAQN